MRIVLAFLSAISLPTMLLTAWYLYGQFQTFQTNDPYIWVRTGGFLWLTFLISSGFVLILGLPTFFLLRYFKVVRWWSTLVVGFILGAVPMAIFSWPLKYAKLKLNSSVNGVKIMIDGIPTMAGWEHFIEGVCFFGACGLVAALAFWLVAPKKAV